MVASTNDDDLEIISAGSFWGSGRLKAVVWLAILAVILSLQIWFPRIDSQVNDTYNVDNGGRNALFQFVSRRLPDVSRNHEQLPTRLTWMSTQETLCILGPARTPSPREWEAILNWVSRGGSLVFAAKWNKPECSIPRIGVAVDSTVASQTEPKSRPDKDKGKATANPPENTPPKESAEAPPTPQQTPIDTKTALTANLAYTWKSNGKIRAPGADVLVASHAGLQAARLRHGTGTIVLTASDYIFSNTALFEENQQNGLLVVRLLEAAGTSDALVFDESLNETGTPRVVGLLLDPVLRPATVQVAALLAVFGWYGSRRFGPLLPKARKPRHDVSDHTNSLGNLYYRAHHGTGVLREYFEQLKTELKLRFSVARESRQLRSIAERANLTPEEVQARLKNAEAAVKKQGLPRHVAAGHIRKLAVLRQAHHARSVSSASTA
jgi:hypothetical protein